MIIRRCQGIEKKTKQCEEYFYYDKSGVYFCENHSPVEDFEFYTSDQTTAIYNRLPMHDIFYLFLQKG